MVREWSEVDIGQSWDKGPVVLSWKDVEASGLADGFNEVIYEAVHRLDLFDGAVNGRPTFQESAIYSPRNHSWNFGRRKASLDLSFKLTNLESNDSFPPQLFGLGFCFVENVFGRHNSLIQLIL
jgi:hypothetical protein